MPLPRNVKSKLDGQFAFMIEEGHRLMREAKHEPGKPAERWSLRADHIELTEWGVRCATLLDHVLPSQSPHRSDIDMMRTIDNYMSQIGRVIGVLRAIRADLSEDLFDTLRNRVESAIASDYMSQAEGLLRDGKRGAFDHVPAAVLAGAVLESALRALCLRQSPVIDVDKPTGEPKAMNALIDDLAREPTAVFNQTKAKQLRAYAHIRNKAAHGEFTEFTRADVEQMIAGIDAFLADYA